MVCLKADAGRLDQIMREIPQSADFVDEDLENMRTAVAVGPFERDVGYSLFGDLNLA